MAHALTAAEDVLEMHKRPGNTELRRKLQTMRRWLENHGSDK